MVEPIKHEAKQLAEAIVDKYRQGETDYWLSPLVVADSHGPVGRVQAGDVVVFCCRRGEREIQLTRAFADPSFGYFPRADLAPLLFVPLTRYHPDLWYLPAAFAPQDITDTVGEVVSREGLGQLRAAEEEKYTHITYFLSGGRAEAFPGERDIRVPSFLSDPPRALPGLGRELCSEWAAHDPAWVAVNIATGDISGHASAIEPKIACAEAVDVALEGLLDFASQRGGWSVITADHGLLEDHGPPGGPPNNAHTTNLVPMVVVGPRGERPRLRLRGALANVAPTILSLIGLAVPEAMTGLSLLLDRRAAEQPVLLVILDGWGLPVEGRVNPVALADTPCWDALQRGPMAQLDASGEAVGLLPGRKGNSEAGHLNIGAGRVVPQDEVRIEQAIAAGTFTSAPALQQAVATVNERDSSLHLIGLLSHQSSHGSIDYVVELLEFARRENVLRVYVHLITDGRSTIPGTAPQLVRELGQEMAKIGTGMIVTAMGRGLALDRGGDYLGKTQRAYRALVYGEGTAVHL
ncbi:MAG TPA: phosphoglycerate mutase (2,3-diphosphoglycerate-independent) [Candidatus Bipolaricaulis anaerobius]|jgi:2,3-bisphosphoglycerate-independent phosphoglycerate mutase|nr:phosphoglycerate mutase (2,3-diphosphoglycerate-independent) [Candidatus Bipolaricaulis anaerobius]HNS23943.1 phosphoglycerate mutase (2,3-diphosphoglycerate-independent) [Candidatus Bipolaricaulis anaerobius]